MLLKNNNNNNINYNAHAPAGGTCYVVLLTYYDVIYFLLCCIYIRRIYEYLLFLNFVFIFFWLVYTVPYSAYIYNTSVVYIIMLLFF